MTDDTKQRRMPRIGSCSETACERPITARGLCGRHYKQLQAAALPPCRICGRIGAALGLCAMHYRLQRLADAPTCSEDGCERTVAILKRGLCEMHYKRDAYRTAGQGRCVVVGCGKRVSAAGLKCSRHGRKLRGLTFAEREDYFGQIRGRCDVCAVPITLDTLYIDHDHAHCLNGCRKCVRGFICPACNSLEGMIAAGIERGAIGAWPAGRLADYRSQAPLQNYLAVRD